MNQYASNPQPYNAPDQGTGMAIGALVCGLLSFCLFPAGIVAVILGLMFLSKTRDNQEGRGMAMAGTILGAAGMVLSIAALLIAILLPALGAARRTAQRMQNSTQLRGIHQGLVTYANSNKNNFPGLTSSGDILADGADTGYSGDGSAPAARLWILLDGNYFTPDYAISPSEIDPIYAYSGTGPLTSDNYSYAMLNYETTGSVQTDRFSGKQYYSINQATAGRVME